MAKVLLDVGARGPAQVERIKAINPSATLMYLYGREHTTELWNGVVEVGKTQGTRGTLTNFGVADESVDVVTYSGEDPRVPVAQFVHEIERTLTYQGVFIDAHPLGLHLNVDDTMLTLAPLYIQKTGAHLTESEFELVAFPRCWKSVARIPLEHNAVFLYPGTPEITRRLSLLRILALGGSLPLHIRPLIQKPPTLRVWVKC